EDGDHDRLMSLLESVRDGRSDPDQVEAAGESGSRQSGDRVSVSTLRVDLTRLDKLLNLAGEVYIGQGRLNRLLEDAAARDATLAGAIWQLDQLHTEIQDEVMRLRMIPLGPTFRQYRRTLRDLAREAGKQAVLVTEGDEVEVDTAIVDRIRDPITHMLRNAIDHGLETPEERALAGKNPTGRISLRARHSSGGVIIEVSDDGRGLDRDRIRARAVALGVIADGTELTDAEMLHLIFTPGFSTATAVTELSGRGVGMDVVRRDIEALRGTVKVDSTPGGGTTIVLRLPLTVAIIHGFVVAVGEERYVIPLDAVEECAAFQVRSQGRDCQPGVLTLRGAPLSYIHLRESFSLPGVPAARSSVVVIRHEDRRIGIVVDELLGERQAVIRPLSESIRQVEGFAGSTILDTGRVALILNVSNLVAKAGSPEAELALVP
ncbi:MAG TPA: chemotaxis protein CheA, partial [Gemmatimonadales bacterium]|nr:chemotaxis protein CheA [Gemmatimonadales bacterium]